MKSELSNLKNYNFLEIQTTVNVSGNKYSSRINGSNRNNKELSLDKKDSKRLIIYSKYFNNNEDSKLGTDVDNIGNVYIVGIITSTNFSVTNNAPQKSFGGVADAFVMKINPKLKGKDSIIYATYLGGSQSDFGLGIKVDKDGSAYVTGRTNSTDFPVTSSAVQPFSRGGGEAFLTKLKPDGTIDFSTYLGGTGSDYAYSVDLDDAGNPCVAGTTDSQDFLVSFNAFQFRPAGKSDAFVTCLNQAGNSILYSTYFGGNGFDDAYEIKIPSKNKIQIIGNTEGNLPAQNTEMFTQEGDNNFKAEFEIQTVNLSKNTLEKRR